MIYNCSICSDTFSKSLFKANTDVIEWKQLEHHVSSASMTWDNAKLPLSMRLRHVQSQTWSKLIDYSGLSGVGMPPEPPRASRYVWMAKPLADRSQHGMVIEGISQIKAAVTWQLGAYCAIYRYLWNRYWMLFLNSWATMRTSIIIERMLCEAKKKLLSAAGLEPSSNQSFGQPANRDTPS